MLTESEIKRYDLYLTIEVSVNSPPNIDLIITSLIRTNFELSAVPLGFRKEFQSIESFSSFCETNAGQ